MSPPRGRKLLAMTPHPEATAPSGSTPAAMPSGTARAAPCRPSHRHVAEPSLNRLALSATAHCLTGCATGEVLGMVVGTALEWTALRTVALAVVLAFVFGYALTSVPLLRSGMMLGAVVPIALAADTVRSPSWRSWTTRSWSSSREP